MIAALLLAATVTTFPLGDHTPRAIVTHGPILRFVAWKGMEPFLGTITAAGRVHLESMPKENMPGLFAKAPDGTVWLTDAAQPVLWRFDRNGRRRAVPVDAPNVGIAFGSDGALWCTLRDAGGVRRYETTGGAGRWYFIDKPNVPVSTIAPGPKATLIASGPDGALWFTDNFENHVGRISTDGTPRLFDLPGGWSGPLEIISGADGALWFTSVNVPLLGRITVDGTITSIDLRNPAHGLAVDGRGRIWFGYQRGGAGYLDRDGTLHDVDVPGEILALTLGPDGNLWFATSHPNAISRISD